MFICAVETPPLAAFSYIVADMASHRCVVIDPVRHILPIVQQLALHQLRVEAIIETHVHADFVSGAVELKHQLQGYPSIYSSAAGGPEWFTSYADVAAKDGEVLEIGVIRLQGCHTPGHTPEHMSWLAFEMTRSSEVPCAAFTGDFLFTGSVGRPDLLGVSATEKLSHALYHSLFDTIKSWPDFLALYPAHGSGSLCGKAMGMRLPTTLGYERITNPALQERSYELWSSEILTMIPRPPRSFQYIKQINRQGARLYSDLPISKRIWTAEELLKSRDSGLFIVDIRSPDRFAMGHFPGGVNIPWSPSFCTWLGMVVPNEAPVLIVLDEGMPFENVAISLALVAVENVVGFCPVNTSTTWGASLPWISPEELASRSDITVVDVRTPEEWLSSHIPRACHLELASLSDHVDTIPASRPIAVICGSGMRASVAASWLQRHGVTPIYNVRGGMVAWSKASLPTER